MSAMSKAMPQSQADATLLQDFKAVGFTEYEAKVYMQLLRSGAATAYEIAKESGVPRPNTYNALESLSKRGSVLPVSENPRRYVANDPKAHLASIGRGTMALCDSLAEKLSQLAPPDDAPYVWNVQGEIAMREKVDALIAECAHTLWIKASSDVLAAHTPALRAAAERGAHMLIVIFGDDPELFRFTDRCAVYLHENTGVRMGSADNLFTMTVDHRWAMTATPDGPAAFYTRNAAMVKMAETLIRHDYYMAEIFARFGREIEASFGPHLRELRMSVFTDEQVETFRERTGLS